VKNRKLTLIAIILILLLPISFAEIVVQTIGQDNTQTVQTTETYDRHTFLINKYYPLSYQPVAKYPSIMVEQLVAEATINPCEEADFSFKITNSGSKSEIYKFSVEGFDGVAHITPNLLLAPGDARIVQFILKPECSLYGDLNPIIIIETENEKAEIPILLHVEKAYDFSLDFEDNITVCNNIETRLEVKIENLAGMQNNCSISTSKDWITPEYSYVAVDEGSAAVLDLILEPDFKTDTTSIVNVEVTPEYGDSVVKKLTVNSQTCYLQELRLEDKRVCENTDTIYIYLKNRGLFEETFDLILEDDGFYLESTEITLESGTDTIIPVTIKDTALNRQELVLESQIKGKPFSKEIRETVEIVPLQECYRPTLLTKKITVSKNNETNLLQILNLGIHDELYTLELNAPDWVSINEEELFIGKGLTEVVEIFTSPGGDVEESSYKADLILTSKLTGNKYVEEFTITVSEFDLLEYIVENKCCFALLILGLLIVLFFIKFILDAQEEDKKRAVLIDLLVIFVVFILGLVVFTLCFDTFRTKLDLEYQNNINESQNQCLTYYDEELCESSYYIRFDEDSRYKLDLHDMFYDPDSDVLEYSNSEVDNVKLKISNSLVTLTPEKNWHGTEEIIFYVDDGKGGTAESRKFYVHVLDKKEFFVQDLVLDYYVYLFIGLGLILLLIIMFLVFLILID